MKITRLLFLFLIIFQSCYSPKTDIEKDIHPEIPEFPQFSDKNINITKVLELPISQTDNCLFLQKGDYFFIYNFPGYVSDEKKDIRKIFILKEDKIVIFEKWKSILKKNRNIFLDEKANLYVDNRKYFAPDYTRKTFVPFYDLDNVVGKYEHLFHLGESEKDSALLKKINEEKLDLQKNIHSKINKILMVKGESDSVINKYADTYSDYLCNPNQKNSFFVASNFFKKTNGESVKSSSEDVDSLFLEFHSKIKISPQKNNFTRKIQKQNLDSTFFNTKDEIVTGNEYFSRGNHFVASFGYYPVYMYYYDVKIGGKTITTKEDNTKLVISAVAKTNQGRYFVVKNLKENKFQIYYLKD